MIPIILLCLGIVIALFFVVAALQPAEFRISRSISIAAPPAVVFAQVNDFHLWQAWSPWAKMDPTAKNTFEGSPAGTGAVFTWAGNSKVGEGRMTILESRPHNLIKINLEFFKPFKAKNTAEFTFTPEGSQTAVLWSMTGRKNLMAKAFVLVMNCDKMIGGDFEKGLASMREVSENAVKNGVPSVAAVA